LRDLWPLTPPVTEFAPAGKGINNRTTGIRTGNGDFIWKNYQTHADPEAIRYEHRLLTWLSGRGLSFAVPAPIPTCDGDTLVADEEGWSALFALIPGQPPDHNHLGQIEAVGAGLGELHRALAAHPLERRPDFHGYDELSRVHPAIPDPLRLTLRDLGLPDIPPNADLLAWWRDEVAELHEFTQTVYPQLPHQMTHGDYVPSNTLCDGERLAAILDFDMAQPDARAIDIATGLEFSLRPWERDDPLPYGEAFWRGYTRRIQPTDAEMAAIPMLIRLRDAVSTIWWLGRDLTNGRTPDLGRMRGGQEAKRGRGDELRRRSLRKLIGFQLTRAQG
jgi:homoserine kinase type II